MEVDNHTQLLTFTSQKTGKGEHSKNASKAKMKMGDFTADDLLPVKVTEQHINKAAC